MGLHVTATAFRRYQPDDPEKHVWIVDDHKHVIHKFTNDGSELVQSIGIYGELGDDETHFNRPSFLAWFQTAAPWLRMVTTALAS